MRLYGYEVPEMTMVISSLGSYFDANMALLNARGAPAAVPVEPAHLYQGAGLPRPPSTVCTPRSSHSLVADGARVDGTVRNSIIFRDVNIGRDAGWKTAS